MAAFVLQPHMHKIKIPILLFIKLNMWPPGSKTDHPSLCHCVSQQGVRRAATVSASIRTLSLGLLESEVPSGGCHVPPAVGFAVRPLRAEPHLWYIPPVSIRRPMTLPRPRQGQYDEARCLSVGRGKYFTAKAPASRTRVSRTPLLSRHLGEEPRGGARSASAALFHLVANRAKPHAKQPMNETRLVSKIISCSVVYRTDENTAVSSCTVSDSPVS